MRHASSMVGILALVLFSLACNAPSPAAQATAAPPTATPVPPTPTPAGLSFSNLMGAGKNATYKVTYKMSGNAGGQALSGEQIIFAKSPNYRMDMNGMMGGQSGAFSTYMLADGTFICAGRGGQTTCFKGGMPGGAGAPNTGDDLQQKLRTNPDDYVPTSEGARTIIGQQAQCFGVKPKTASGDFTNAIYCLANQGVPLFMQVKGTNLDMTMEATSFSTTVSDADFTLPAPAMDMPAIPGGIPNVPR